LGPLDIEVLEHFAEGDRTRKGKKKKKGMGGWGMIQGEDSIKTKGLRCVHTKNPYKDQVRSHKFYKRIGKKKKRTFLSDKVSQ